LNGSGSVSLGGGSGSEIRGSSTLTNLQTISGQGTIKVDTLINEGTISAAAGGGYNFLTIEPGSGGVTNSTGTLTAGGGGDSTLEISGGTVANTGGTISSGNGFAFLVSKVNVSGGTIFGSTNYVEGKSATLDGSVNPITITGLFDVLSGDQTTLIGTINNTGNIFVSGSPDAALLHVSGTTVLNGDGELTLGNDTPLSEVVGNGVGASLTNFNNFNGNGIVSKLSFINNGTVQVDYAAAPLTFDNTTTFKNSKTVSVPVGTLQVFGGFSNFSSKNGTLSGGVWNVTGTFQFTNANINTNAANIALTYPGQIEDQNGKNALASFSTNGAHGSFTLAGGWPDWITGGTLTNAGVLTIQRGNELGIGGSGTSYQQNGTTAITTVDGALNVAAGELINIAAGKLEGVGSLNGNVSVGNPVGGATATFIIGDSMTQAGALSVTQNYTQLATGVMDTQIGGTTQGSQYSQLTVTGPVSLSGVLNIKLINKFKPQVGQTFTILNAPSGITGTFTTVNGLSINANEHFSIAYNSTSIVLTVEPGP
jgi:hypothetical protein